MVEGLNGVKTGYSMLAMVTTGAVCLTAGITIGSLVTHFWWDAEGDPTEEKKQIQITDENLKTIAMEVARINAQTVQKQATIQPATQTATQPSA